MGTMVRVYGVAWLGIEPTTYQSQEIYHNTTELDSHRDINHTNSFCYPEATLKLPQIIMKNIVWTGFFSTILPVFLHIFVLKPTNNVNWFKCTVHQQSDEQSNPRSVFPSRRTVIPTLLAGHTYIFFFHYPDARHVILPLFASEE